MNAFLEALTAIAVVGTARKELVLPAVAGETGELLAALAATAADPAATLLRAAAAAALFADAGRMPGRPGLVLAEAPDETLPVAAGAGLQRALADILADGPERLQHQVLRQLAQRERLLPPLLLPRALEAGARVARLRERVRPVLGARGAWLAAQNPDWHWALALPEAADAFDWTHAPQEQRLAWLDRELPRAPELARARLQEGFVALAARERLQLLERLAAHVEATDAAFLQGLLADRSKEVRQLAAALLSRLPGSDLALRLGEWLAPCLGKRRKLLREVLEFEPPEAFSPEWKAFTLEEDKPAHESMGQRAWWTFQLVRLTPLAWWLRASGMAPLELLEWAKAGDWSQPLLRGWLQAMEQQQDPEWADAWLRFEAPRHVHPEPYRLLRLLPPARREQHWREIFRRLGADAPLGAPLRQLLDSLAPGECIADATLAAQVLEQLRQSRLQKDYELRTAVPELACVLPDSLLAVAADLREHLAHCASNDAAARFGQVIDQRRLLNSVLQEEPS